VVSIDQTAVGGVRVTLNGEVAQFDKGAISAITVNPGAGNNTINVLALSAGMALNVQCAGDDTVNVGKAGRLGAIKGNVSVSDATRFVTLNVNDSADRTSHNNVIISSAGITGLAPGSITYRQTDLSALNIAGGPGGASGQVGSTIYNVLSTPFDGQFPLTTTLTCGGDDTVNVGAAGSLFGIQGNLMVADPTRFVTLNVDDSADTTSLTNVTISSSSITGMAFGNIGYEENDLNALNVTGSPGGTAGVVGSSVYNVVSTPFNGQFPVTTSLTCQGDDTVNVGNAGSLQAIQGNLAVTDPNRFVTLNVDDSADTTAHTNVMISSAGISGLSFGNIG
jgi:hypothetical protein